MNKNESGKVAFNEWAKTKSWGEPPESTAFKIQAAEGWLAAEAWLDPTIQRLEAENERLRDFVQSVADWTKAYPKNVFPSLTPEQVNAVCQKLGFNMDRLSAMMLREISVGWSKKAEWILEQEDK